MGGLNLGKQYGPLPLGGWIAVIIGGLGIGYFINRSQGSGSSTGDGDVEQPAGEESGAGGGQLIYNPPTNVPAPDSTITDNATWAFRAKSYLIAKFNNPVASNNAVEKYLDGMTLTQQEQELINQVLTYFGPPPEPISPTETPNNPPDNPPTPVAKPRIRLTIRSHPSTIRRGAQAYFSGYISETIGNSSKPLATVLAIELKRPNSRLWSPYTADASNAMGGWDLTMTFKSAGTWGFRVRHLASGKAAETTVRVT